MHNEPRTTEDFAEPVVALSPTNIMTQPSLPREHRTETGLPETTEVATISTNLWLQGIKDKSSENANVGLADELSARLIELFQDVLTTPAVQRIDHLHYITLKDAASRFYVWDRGFRGKLGLLLLDFDELYRSTLELLRGVAVSFYGWCLRTRNDETVQLLILC